MRKTGRSGNFLLTAWPVILCLLFLLTFLTVKAAEGSHDFSPQECARCHPGPYGKPGELAAPVTKLCKGCHYKTIRSSSHPVDVVPLAARVPSDLPLSEGRITCATCHDVHGSGMLAFGVKSYLLRRPGTDIGYFCRACHEHNGHAPGHKELAGTAHLGSASKKAGYGGELDPLSASCIACHDGAAASSVEVETRRFYSEHSSGGSHPIGIDYGKQGRPPRGRGLAPASRLDRRIKLFGGRVGCGTCHDFYSATAGRLVMSNDGSRLCRECHIDK